jgi:hypothetical protein
MSHVLIKVIEETFSSLENFTPEKFQALIEETVKSLKEIQTKIHSKDEKEREAGVKVVLELKKALESQADALCKKVGMSPVELSRFIENPANFSQEEWKAMEKAQGGLEAFKKELQVQQGNEQKVIRLPKKRAKTWLIG